MRIPFATLVAAAAFAFGSAPALAQADAAPIAIPAPVVKKAPVDTPQRVLFIGNSLMYSGGGLQTHLHRLAAAIDPRLAILDAGYKSVHITGATLEPYPVDYLTKPGSLGIKEPFQLAVLASSAREPMTAQGRANYRRKVLEWDAAMKKQGGRIALIWLQPVTKPKWNEEMFRRNGELVVGVANEVGAYVIPIGPAFQEAYRLRPDLKLQESYDGYHPTDAGQYLSSAVAFASIYGRSPEGADYDYFGAIDKATAAFLLKVANDTVQKFYGQ